MTNICTVDAYNILRIIIYWQSCVLICLEIIEIIIINRPAKIIIIIIIIRDPLIRSILDNRFARTTNYDKIQLRYPKCYQKPPEYQKSQKNKSNLFNKPVTFQFVIQYLQNTKLSETISSQTQPLNFCFVI